MQVYNKKSNASLPACMPCCWLIYGLPGELSAGGSCASRQSWGLQWDASAPKINLGAPEAPRDLPAAAEDAGETLASPGGMEGGREWSIPQFKESPARTKPPPQRESPSSGTRCAASRFLTSLMTQVL